MNPIKNIKDLIVVTIGVEIESNLICFVIDRYNNTNTIVIIDLINRIWNKFTLPDSNFMIISSNVQTYIPITR